MAPAEGKREKRRGQKNPSKKGTVQGKERRPAQVPGEASTRVKNMLSDMKIKENINDIEINSPGVQAHGDEKRLYNHRDLQRTGNNALSKPSGSTPMPGALHTDLSNSGAQKQEPVYVHRNLLQPPTNVSPRPFGRDTVPSAPRNDLQDIDNQKQEPIWVHRDLLQSGNNSFSGTIASTFSPTDLQYRTEQQTPVPYTWECIPDSENPRFAVCITDNTGDVYIWEDAFKIFQRTTQVKGQAALVAWCYELAKADHPMCSKKAQIAQENGEHGTKGVDQLSVNVPRPKGYWKSLGRTGDSQALTMSSDMRFAGVGEYGDDSNMYNSPYMAKPGPQHMDMSPGYEQLQKTYIPSFQTQQPQYQSLAKPPLYTLQSPLKIQQAQGLGLCLDVQCQGSMYTHQDFLQEQSLSSMMNQNFAKAGSWQSPYESHEKQPRASSYATPGNATSGTGPKRPGHRRLRAGFYRKKGMEGGVKGNEELSRENVNVPVKDADNECLVGSTAIPEFSN